MIHLNGNKLCVFDVETTGLDPYKHDIWQFCCLPLDFGLKLDKKFTPCELMLSPRNIENRAPGAISKANFNKAVLSGLNYEVSANVFVEWCERLGLGFKKRIMPLAHNWPFDREFIIEWLGRETFEFYIDPRFRDTMTAGAFINDVCDHKAERVPLTALNLRAIANCLGVSWDDYQAHDAVYDCIKTAEVYRKLILNANYIAEEQHDTFEKV